MHFDTKDGTIRELIFEDIVLWGHEMKLLSAILALVIAGPASALTVTFDGDVIGPGTVPGADYLAKSQGFLYDGSFAYAAGQFVQLHDDSGLLSTTIRAQNGTRFTPNSIDVRGFSHVNKAGSAPKPSDPNDVFAWASSGIAPPATLTFQGVRNNRVVATKFAGPMDWSTLRFSKAFRRVDSLILSLNIPASAQSFFDSSYGIGAATPGLVWCAEWCGEFWADNLNLDPNVAPVPLPPASILLLSALLGMFGLSRFGAFSQNREI
ncbi:MAG: hypothetical protein ACWA49_07565 [Ruegeria sp.]